jgi:lipoprotein-releasing system ATP-binding protein
MSDALLTARNLHRTFRMGDVPVTVLRGVNLDVQPGEFVAIEGRSGSGKSTLLHTLGALDRIDDGIITFDGEDFSAVGAKRRAELRNTQFGFVFQFYHLLPELNVLENTQLAAMVKHAWLGFRSAKRALREKAETLLESLGMSHRLRHRPAQLSGGERQRVALARALMNEPRVLFADEPTGNLDADTGKQIMSLLETLHVEKKQTIVMVTHDRTLARRCDRVLVMKDGVLAPAEN